jgi:hypothetical protein
MGWAALPEICGSVAKVAAMIVIPAANLAVPAGAASSFGDALTVPAALGDRIGTDNPTCALDPAHADPLNPLCQPNGRPYDDDDVDFGFGGIADTGISSGGVADGGIGIGDSGVGGIP